MTNQTMLKQTARYMMYGVAGLTVLFLLVGLVVIQFIYPFEPPLAFSLGLVLGSLLTVFKIYLLQRSIQQAVDQEEHAAKNYATLQFLLRHGLTLGFLVLCVLSDHVGLFGGILGFLTMQFSAYIANYLLSRKEKAIKEAGGKIYDTVSEVFGQQLGVSPPPKPEDSQQAPVDGQVVSETIHSTKEQESDSKEQKE